MSDIVLGTPCKCKHCGYVTKVRLKRGVRLSEVLCVKCGNRGFRRWTEYDREVSKTGITGVRRET